MAKFKVLAVHGVGRHTKQGIWEQQWKQSLNDSLSRVDAAASFEIEFVTYDDIFSDEDITAFGTLEAVGKLVGSGLWHGAGDWFDELFRHRGKALGRGFGELPERIRWTAGMVTQWAENSKLRSRTRTRLRKAIEQHKPSLIIAHSLGSLIAYDCFIDPENQGLISNRTFVSFGSQIGNPFVRSQFGGRIVTLNCRAWFHLFNPADDIFTSRLQVVAENFEQIDATFDIEGFADHDASSYLSHSNMSAIVWSEMLSKRPIARQARLQRQAVNRRGSHKRRALLVGINEYPQQEQRLEGCVNDVFLMSSLLQESGFDASEIRTVFNDRATADGIRSRLEWLLDGAGANDERVFFYSGHGAQITDYGLDEVVDRKDECLVPWDFDWSREMAVTDDYFYELYSQLPYESRFLVIMDCCHSGGMTRAGAGRPRGIIPPDDIRHRELRWNAKRSMWQPRSLVVPNKSLATGTGGNNYLGADNCTRKLGAAVDLRGLSNSVFDRVRSQQGHHGPYLPIIAQACQESELAYEYRHGVTSYGAFTYSLAAQIRKAGRRGCSYETLIDLVATDLRALGYEQKPNLVGPASLLSSRIPFN